MRPEDQRPESGEVESSPRYTVVPRTLIFVLREEVDGHEEVLLLKGAPTKRLWAGQYNGIGGHLEAGESPESSARRELREETGLDIARLELRGIVHITMPAPPGIVLFVYVGLEPRGTLHSSAEGEPVWVARGRIPALPLVEDLPELLPRLFAAHAERGMMYGVYHVTDEGLQMAFT